MKRTLQAAITFAAIAMLLTGTVSAATSQGLEWGIAVDDQWNFDLKSVEDGVVDFEEVIYFEVLTRPTIPNIVTALDQIPAATFNLTWANGTSLGFSALIFIFFFVATPRFAFPIGNYTLIGELYTADTSYNGTVFENSGYWGVRLDGLEFSDTIFDIGVDYLKQDGMLAHWTVNIKNATTSEVTGSLSMTRQNLPGFNVLWFIQDNMLLVGIGVGVIVILGAVVCMRKK